jgi:solute carrier family 35 protein F5
LEVYARPFPENHTAKDIRCCKHLANYTSNAIQTIFADRTYPKPFFVTYTNTSMFMMPLLFIVARRTWGLWRNGKLSQITSLRSFLNHLDSHDPKAEEESMLRSGSDEGGGPFSRERQDATDGKLGLKATAKLSIQFCLLWVST